MNELYEARRARLTAAIPGWYRWWAHLAGTTIIGLGVAAFAVSWVRAVHWADFFTVVVAFFLANGIEWAFHKDLMHRRVPWLPQAYEGHTSEHHQVFTDQSMEIREYRELKMVMLPFLTLAVAYGTLLLIGVVFGLFRTNVGAIWVASGATYLIIYEWLHTLYHLPLRSRLVEKLREHHQTHHRLSLMNWWNFNVTFPIWDRIMGTYKRPEEPLSDTQKRVA